MNKSNLFDMLIKIAESVPALIYLVAAISALIGLVFAYGSLRRAMKDAEQGQLDGGRLIWGLFFAVLLTSPAIFINMVGNTLGGESLTAGSFRYNGMGMTEKAKMALQAFYMIAALLGRLAFIRGVMLWRKVSTGDVREGNGAGFVYVIAGVLMVYLSNTMELFASFTGFHLLDQFFK